MTKPEPLLNQIRIVKIRGFHNRDFQQFDGEQWTNVLEVILGSDEIEIPDSLTQTNQYRKKLADKPKNKIAANGPLGKRKPSRK